MLKVSMDIDVHVNNLYLGKWKVFRYSFTGFIKPAKEKYNFKVMGSHDLTKY